MATRELLANDPHRPQYHFLPPSNWMNDPNGLIQWRGQYHLFYQHNPLAPVFGTIHWGHAASHDLVHWRDLPLAISPTSGSADEDGVWSGCAVEADGQVQVLYTGLRRHADGSRSERPCLATSTDDDLQTWHKYAGNPVIASPPPGLDLLGFRDHSVWREGESWYQAIGSGIRGAGGVVLVYRSPDLQRWDYVGPLCQGDPAQTGDMWECPDFFKLGGRHVLMVSPIPLRKTIYFTGEYRDQRFTPLLLGDVDAEGCFYAPQSFTDALGRRIMFGWLREEREAAEQVDAGWAGVMSLPRLLQPRNDGRLGMEPLPELRALRGRRLSLHEIPLDASRTLEVSGAALEIGVELRAGTAAQVGVSVRRSPDGVEQTRIVYDAAARSLSIDGVHSSLDPAVKHEMRSAFLETGPAETLRLRIFVDHSVLEVFANEHVCLTSRLYPTRADSLGVELFATGGSAYVNRLDVWEAAAIWPGGASRF